MNNLDDLLNQLLSSAPAEASEFEQLKPANEAPKKGASYFEQKQFYSRSDLLKIEKPNMKPFQPAFRMGSIIDAFLTEPEQFIVQYMNKLTEFEALQLVRIRHAFIKSGILPDEYWHYQNQVVKGLTATKPKGVKFQAEYYRQKFDCFGDGSTFIPVRSKLDVQIGSKIIDIKSTTKTAYLDFMKDIESHQLDMQAAFYADIAKAESFTLIVLPYQNPQHAIKALKGSLKNVQQAVNMPDVWFHKFTDSQLQKGRDKYRAIIRKGINNSKIRTVK